MEKVMGFLLVGLGGGLGAMLRYAVSMLPYKGTFPLLTLIVNLLAAVIIGFVTSVASKSNSSEYINLFFRTGVCGGFSTLSALSLEAYTMIQGGNTGLAVFYSLLSLALCIGGVWLGMAIGSLVVKS